MDNNIIILSLLGFGAYAIYKGYSVQRDEKGNFSLRSSTDITLGYATIIIDKVFEGIGHVVKVYTKK